MTDDATTPHDALDRALHDTEAAVGQALEASSTPVPDWSRSNSVSATRLLPITT